MSTKLIVALDVKSFDEAKELVDLLSPEVGLFKVGSTLYTLAGRQIIEYIHSKGGEVFLDLKFFDIPNQVRGVSFAAASLGVEMFTIHLLGGREMALAAIEGVMEASQIHRLQKTPLILGVTILTSMNDSVIRNELKINAPVIDMVGYLAQMGYDEGLRGFVCSPYEVEGLKKRFSDIKLVTPGVRLPGEVTGDQKRVMTPADAKRLGSDYIVMGRSVYNSRHPMQTTRQIKEQLKD
jgi:orotidine-5'-phosphate decarboxylase